MGFDATVRRRWLGGAALVGAIAMLICGQTLFRGSFEAPLFILYWLGCFLLTGVAMVTAIRDLRDLQTRTRDEQRHLLETTLKDIETEAKRRRHDRKS